MEQARIEHAPNGSLLTYITSADEHTICLKDYRITSFLSILHAHGDLCKYLGIDSSTDQDDRHSNLFLNAYINRHDILNT